MEKEDLSEEKAKTIKKCVGYLIRHHRQKRNISLVDVATVTKIPLLALGKLENGSLEFMSSRYIFKLETLFGLGFNSLSEQTHQIFIMGGGSVSIPDTFSKFEKLPYLRTVSKMGEN